LAKHSSSSSSSNAALLFEQQLADLASWKDTFGTCHVPRTATDAASLSSWVSAMRKAGQKKQEGKQQGKQGSGGLTEQQRQQLDALGFVWRPDTVSSSTSKV
jgi:hypothetical protein